MAWEICRWSLLERPKLYPYGQSSSFYTVDLLSRITEMEWQLMTCLKLGRGVAKEVVYLGQDTDRRKSLLMETLGFISDNAERLCQVSCHQVRLSFREMTRSSSQAGSSGAE